MAMEIYEEEKKEEGKEIKRMISMYINDYFWQWIDKRHGEKEG